MATSSGVAAFGALTPVGPSWRSSEVAEFLALTFGATWSLHTALALTGERFALESPLTAALYLPGLLAPTVAALLVERHHRGRSGVGELLRLGSVRTVRRACLAAAVLAQPVVTGAALAASGGSATIAFDPAMAAGQVWVVAGEEFGWRGWLWPRAVSRFGAMRGTVLVTAVWGLWHLPMFGVADSPQADDGALAFAAAVAFWGALHGALQLPRRSVATAMVFHAVANITASTVDVESAAARIGVNAAAAAVVLWWVRRRSRTTTQGQG